MTPGDHFIETPDGKHRLTFGTRKEAEQARAFMDSAIDIGRQRGEDGFAASVEFTIETLDDFVKEANELLRQLRLSVNKPAP